MMSCLNENKTTIFQTHIITDIRGSKASKESFNKFVFCLVTKKTYINNPFFNSLVGFKCLYVSTQRECGYPFIDRFVCYWTLQTCFFHMDRIDKIRHR